MIRENYDKTLVDEEITRWATDPDWKTKGGIYQDFEPNNVKGETYDIRAGDLVVLDESCKGEGGFRHLNELEEIVIEPFRAATVQSLERIKLPTDMFGELWITNALQHRGLAFTGGGIDPGFWGYLYIKIHNVGQVPVRLRYQEDIASIRFVRMPKAVTKPYTETEILRPSDEQLPPCPLKPLYDWPQMSSKLDEINDETREIKGSVENIERVQERYVDYLITGVITGVILALLLLLFRLLGLPVM